MAGDARKLTLAGVALGAVLSGISHDRSCANLEAVRTASLLGASAASADARSTLLGSIAPFIGVGLVLALLVARPLNALALGDDLGRVARRAASARTRVLTIVAVTLLAGGATALAGPIAFVGLMVPHVVRWFTGPDQRWIIPYSMVGAAILLLADILGRVVLPSGELRVGIVTAFVGGPVLIVLVRRRG